MMKQKAVLATSLSALLLCAQIEKSHAVEIEPWTKAVAAIVKKMKDVGVKKLSIGGKPVEVYFSKDAQGKANQLAFIEHGLYPPDCTHTWAIGIDGKSGKVTQVRVIEMKCNHAFPTKAASFLDQFTKKGPADANKLEGQIMTIAKATGSSNLTTDAVKRSIQTWQKLKGKI